MTDNLTLAMAMTPRNATIALTNLLTKKDQIKTSELAKQAVKDALPSLEAKVAALKAEVATW